MKMLAMKDRLIKPSRCSLKVFFVLAALSLLLSAAVLTAQTKHCFQFDSNDLCDSHEVTQGG